MENIEQPYVQYMYSYPHKTAYRELSGINLGEEFKKLTGKNNSLYFHIPFCQYKCGYCNLFSIAGASEKYMTAYVDSMERQAEQFAKIMPKGVCFSDLTFGGGTPLYLTERLLERVFKIAKDYFTFASKDYDIIVETSPNQTTDEKAALLKENSVTRVSIGVQSFIEKELESIFRMHTAETAKKAIAALKRQNFDSLNIDIIYGIPKQTKDTLKESLSTAVSYKPQEMFVYPLYVKPGTALQRKCVRPDSNTYELYNYTNEFLHGKGYSNYSMRRYFRTGNEQKNDKYVSCGFENTLSIGCGGRSYIDRLHFCTPYAVEKSCCVRKLDEYIKKNDYLNVTNGIILSDEEMKRRYVIKNILFATGVSLSGYRSLFASSLLEDFPFINEWAACGFAEVTGDNIRLTDKGISYSDALGPMLISEEIADRMRQWYKDAREKGKNG